MTQLKIEAECKFVKLEEVAIERRPNIAPAVLRFNYQAHNAPE